MLSVLAFLFGIGVLVTIHEFGHYWAARSCGVRVLRFSVGFGKTCYRYQRTPDATEWVLAWLPLGGYVKMLDRRSWSEDVSAHALREETVDWSQAFDVQPVWQKMWIVFAGPLANLLLAFACYWLLFMQGEVGLRPILGPVVNASPAAVAKLREGDTIISIQGQSARSWQDVHWQMLEQAMSQQDRITLLTRTPLGEVHTHTMSLADIHVDGDLDVIRQAGMNVAMPKVAAVIGEVMSGSVADQSGLRSGDRILAVNGKNVEDWQQFVKIIRASPLSRLRLTVMRQQQMQVLRLTPEQVVENGKKIGRLGAGVDMQAVDMRPFRVVTEYTPLQAAGRAGQKMSETISFTLRMIGRMVVGQASLKTISGPVSIADAAGDSAALGWQPYVAFIALLSISVAVMNLLPIPVLDGGHLMYHMAEWIRGEPLPEKWLEIGQRLGIGLLGALMVIAFFNDISRYIAG